MFLYGLLVAPCLSNSKVQQWHENENENLLLLIKFLDWPITKENEDENKQEFQPEKLCFTSQLLSANIQEHHTELNKKTRSRLEFAWILLLA